MPKGHILVVDDEVEIRVSNRTVARGEVVAVDGNYGVRIVKMLSDVTP